VDFRTYLKLESSFTGRLVDSWKKEHADVCDRIESLCKDRKWDEARLLVSSIDLTDVGQRNAEWIKYYLRTFAVFGASLVSKDKPSFVGVGWFDSMLNNVASVFLQYLEHNATTTTQESFLQLIAQHELENSTVKADHSYGIAMVVIDPKSALAEEIARLRSLVSDDDLAGKGKDVGEDHVTVRYGLLGGEDQLEGYLRSQKPCVLVTSGIKVFDATEHSEGACPLVVQITSNDLVAINNKIDDYGVWNKRSFAEYTPHITLAYVKESEAGKYSSLLVNEVSYVATTVEVRDNQNYRKTVPLEDAQLVAKKDQYVKLDFGKQGEDAILLGATLNASRLTSWGFIQEAYFRGVKTYRLEATLDGRTSKFCRMIHGKEFKVEDARTTIIKAVNGASPDDLKAIQPWPKQTVDSMKEFRGMSTDDLAARGFHLPPFHPSCRTICVLAGEESEIRTAKPEVSPEDQILPTQVVSESTFQELGITTSQTQVEFWNRYVGVSPTEMLSSLSGSDPLDVVKEKNYKALTISPDSGEVDIALDGVREGAKYKLRASLDPLLGIAVLSMLESSAGSVDSQKKMVKGVLGSLVDTATSVGLKEVSLHPGDDLLAYASLGFLPSPHAWDYLRQDVLAKMDTSGKDSMAKLSDADQLLVRHIFESTEPEVLIGAAASSLSPAITELLSGMVLPMVSLAVGDKERVGVAREGLS
jgi:2'-5' RNA ligase